MLALLNYLKGLLWARFSVYDLSVIPLFLLMGQFASTAGFSRSLFRAANTLVGHRNGGVAQAAIIACACFGAICGSSVATAATMSQVALPEMRRLNYSDRLATGTLAAGGTLGILVPPSIILIIYALLAEQSIAKLFAAAVIPGIIAALGYMIAIAIYVRLVPGHAQIQPRASSKERLSAIGEAWPIAAIFVADVRWHLRRILHTDGGCRRCHGRHVGAGIGAPAALLEQVAQCVLPAAQATAMIYTMLLGAAMMNTALAVTQVPTDVATWTSGLDVHPLLIVSGFLAAFVVLTCVLDELAMMLLLLPVLLPTILGLDLFGLDRRAEGDLVRHPHAGGGLGRTDRAAHRARRLRGPQHRQDRADREIYRGIMPFLVSDVVRIVLLLFFPWLTLFAVSLMK